MKKAFIAITVLFLLLLTLLITAPLIFKDQINEIVKTEANKYLNAKLEFSGISLSFLRDFPNLQVRIKNVSITGGDQFMHDTLMYVPLFSLTLDLKSLISGETFVIRKIFIGKPQLALLINESGDENWDIVRSSESSSVPDETSSSYKVDLQRFEIKDATIIYKDDQENMLVTMQGMDHLIKGDFSEDNSNLSLRTLINSMTFYFEEVAYLNKAHVSYEGDLTLDLKNQKYRFHENELLINDLGLNIDGFVEYKKDQIDINLDFQSPEASLKNILSLVPAIYTTDYDQLKAEGVFSVTGKVEGSYTDEKFPSVTLNVEVDQGMIAYEGLPSALTNISMKVLIVNEDGIADKTVIDLQDFKMNIEGNDLSANGRLENYLAYVLQGKTLKGMFATSSQYFDLNSLMMEQTQEEGTEGVSASSDTGGLVVIDVPENIDFTLTAHFDQLLYNDMEMRNVHGEIIIRNKEVNFQDLEMELLGGSMTLNGKYTTLIPEEPGLIIDMDISRFDIQSSYNTFKLMQSYLPIAKMTTGDFSSHMQLSSRLDRSMMPVYSSLSGFGFFSTSKTVIEDIQVFNELADILKIERLKNATIDKIDVSFEFIDGKAVVKPFDFNLTDIKGSLQGFTSLDQSIEYLMELEIPSDEFGSSVNDVLGGFMEGANMKGDDIKVGNTIMLDVIIDGTIANPNINVGIEEFMKNTIDDLKKKAEEELKKAKEEMERKVRNEADKYMAEVERRALKIVTEAESRAEEIRSIAFESAELIRQEADSTGAKLIGEGKKNGMLAEFAAKKASQELIKEADKKATLIINEADHRAVTIKNQAKKEADAIKSEALKKYNK